MAVPKVVTKSGVEVLAVGVIRGKFKWDYKKRGWVDRDTGKSIEEFPVEYFDVNSAGIAKLEKAPALEAGD